MTAEFIISELQSVANPEKAAFLQGFFKTGPGSMPKVIFSWD